MITEVREGKTIATTKHELICLIKDRINRQGNACNLSDIDVSRIKDMSFLFWDFRDFNGDISEWDVSNVQNMVCMFANTKFNGDISKWDVSSVEDMTSMFDNSQFNGDISNWNVSNVVNMSYMFRHSKFNGDVSKWDISNVLFMREMFALSYFNGDLRQWRDKMNPECDCTFMLWSTYTRTH